MASVAGRALAQADPAATMGGDVAAQFTNLEAELTSLWVLVCSFFVFQVR